MFNPNSGDQVARLLHEVMGLPIIDVTPTKSPATGMDTLEKLLNHTTDPKKLSVINALLGLGSVVKILSAFIPAFERAFYKSDGCWYLHGNFNLNGAVSGRLSSSKVNLQQIPSNSIYAEIIKACFVAPKGFLMVGADFNALEARVGALLTKDTAKLCVYTDGYDSHSFNAYGYWANKMPDIQLAKDSDKCYSVTIDGQVHLLKGTDPIELPDGTFTTVGEHYENAYL